MRNFNDMAELRERLDVPSAQKARSSALKESRKFFTMFICVAFKCDQRSEAILWLMEKCPSCAHSGTPCSCYGAYFKLIGAEAVP